MMMNAAPKRIAACRAAPQRFATRCNATLYPKGHPMPSFHRCFLEALALAAVLLLAAGLVKSLYELAGTTLWLAALRDAPWWVGPAALALAALLLAVLVRLDRRARRRHGEVAG